MDTEDPAAVQRQVRDGWRVPVPAQQRHGIFSSKDIGEKQEISFSSFEDKEISVSFSEDFKEKKEIPSRL